MTPKSSIAKVTSARSARRPSRDWAAYDKAQVNAGRLTLWLAPDVFRRPRGNGRRGRNQLYSDELILGALALRKLLRFPYRRLEGLLLGFAELVGHTGPVPDYSTLCERAATLHVPPLLRAAGRVDLILDSTGLRVAGPGEWRRLEGEARKRRYLKLHLAEDAATGEIVDWRLTGTRGWGAGDTTQGERMLGGLADAGVALGVVHADGAYDTGPIRRAAHAGGGRAVIPPKRSARLAGGPGRAPPQPWQRERNQQILACRRDRAEWKEAAGYHRRSRVEATFSRWKTLFGSSLAARTPERQQVEAAVGVWLLNQLLVAGET